MTTTITEMKTFNVSFNKYLYNEVSIEAKDEEEAMRIVEENCSGGYEIDILRIEEENN